jgi:hypothetical protein
MNPSANVQLPVCFASAWRTAMKWSVSSSSRPESAPASISSIVAKVGAISSGLAALAQRRQVLRELEHDQIAARIP